MSNLPNCPKCSSEYTYEDRGLLVCPECFNEWTEVQPEDDKSVEKNKVIRDAHGNELNDGDNVTVIRDLKVKGASKPIKLGTLVKDIRLLHGSDVIDGHDIDCRIDGFGDMKLKSEVVKKHS